MKWQKRLNIGLTIALTIEFILLGAFVFQLSYLHIRGFNRPIRQF